MSQVDESFGAMLRDLERLGVRHDTLVVLTSDNGPEHREKNSWGSSGGLRGAKGYVYEGGIRIPLLVQWPAAIRAPFVIHEPVHQWDLLPTICAIAGTMQPTDRAIDGVSLLGLLLSSPVGARAHELRSPTDGAPCTKGLLQGLQGLHDPAAAADAAERLGGYARLRPYVDALPPHPPLTLLPTQSLPRPAVAASAVGGAALERPVPLFWAMHRGRGGMQYALRSGPWKLLGGYGEFASRGDGPSEGGEVVPWLRSRASIGRVELYLISHDPTERVDLSASHPHVVALLLPELLRMLHETARDGPDVADWAQHSPPCPRFVALLNVTELCCSSATALENADEEAVSRLHVSRLHVSPDER